jgi:peptidoglycan/LPS O-acetylase OafA/YrhL
MKFTRARDLVLAGVIAIVVVNVFLLLEYDSMGPLPTLAGLVLAVLAIVEAVLAFVLRNRINGKSGTRPLNPITAVRAVALAKASSMLGAIMCGAWASVLIYVVPKRSTIQVAGGDTTSGIVGVVCSVILIAAALWLEYCCRAPIDKGDRRNGSNQSHSA